MPSLQLEAGVNGTACFTHGGPGVGVRERPRREDPEKRSDLSQRGADLERGRGRASGQGAAHLPPRARLPRAGRASAAPSLSAVPSLSSWPGAAPRTWGCREGLLFPGPGAWNTEQKRSLPYPLQGGKE